MTNYQNLQRMSKYDLSHLLCNMVKDCDICPMYVHCRNKDVLNGFYVWLGKEVKESKEE